MTPKYRISVRQASDSPFGGYNWSVRRDRERIRSGWTQGTRQDAQRQARKAVRELKKKDLP